MGKVVLGIFTDRYEAEDAIRELESLNYNPKDISIIMKNREDAEDIAHSTGANVAGGAATGATTGGVLGGLAGLLIGIGAITIPGVGAILIGGPIASALGLTGAAATTVSGAVTGALAGGLVGALVGLGVPEEDARYYEESIREGGILVAVPATVRREDEVYDILENNGADQIKVITTKDTDYDVRDRNAVRDDFEDLDYEYRRRHDYDQSPTAYAGMKGGRSYRDEDIDNDDEDYTESHRKRLRRR